MVRVAAVAKQVCDSYEEGIDTNTVISACLLHDMGNLIKSTPADFPELFEPEGVEHWEVVKQETLSKYGKSVKEATFAMISELEVSDKVVAVVEEAQYERIAEIADSGSTEGMLLEYSDMRVGLDTIFSLKERFADIKQRYQITDDEMNEKFSSSLLIEQKIFANCKIRPEDITDSSTLDIQKELWNWKI